MQLSLVEQSVRIERAAAEPGSMVAVRSAHKHASWSQYPPFAVGGTGGGRSIGTHTNGPRGVERMWTTMGVLVAPQQLVHGGNAAVARRQVERPGT